MSHDARAALARQAAEAGTFAAQIINDYGVGSPEAGSALATAQRLSDEAAAAGVGPDEVKAARRAGRGTGEPKLEEGDGAE